MRASRAVLVAGGCAAIVGAGWAVAPKEVATLDLVAPASPTPSAGATGDAVNPSATPTPSLTCEPDDSGDDEGDDKDFSEDEDCAIATPEPSASATASESAPDEPAESAAATFDGPVVTNPRGDYQARITVEDGVVTDVQAVVAGTQDAQSVQINAMAIPELRARVLEAQTWDVDAVSGASFTSPAFVESLEGAFSQAGL